MNVGLYVLDQHSMFSTAQPNAAAEVQMYFNRDIKFGDDAQGPLLIDRTTGTVYRLYMNSGSLAVESI